MKAAVGILDGIFKQLKLKAKVRECRMEGAFLICDALLEPGGKVIKVERHAMEIALAMKALAEPLIYPVPAEGIIRIELMMSLPGDIPFADVVSSSEFQKSNGKLPLGLGRTRRGKILVADLAAMPHLLVAGATGSGKSMILQAAINSLLLNRSDRRVMLALVDPKQVEFSYYERIPHLFCPIARDVQSAHEVLESLVAEMDRRFTVLQKKRCRDISHYKGKMPYIVLIVDELADLMMASKKSVQDLICRLAQKSRACGIHLMVATQRPSTDVVTGVIKANFPSRLSCHVSSAIDSRVVLDKNGAEKLAGRGDAILDGPDFPFVRFKGAFLSEADIAANIRRCGGTSLWRMLWTANGT